MSDSEDQAPKANKMAPAPAPPPHIQERLRQGGEASGFDPKASRTLIELVVAGAVVLGLGAAFVFAGGALASLATPLVPMSVDVNLGSLSQKQMALMEKECTSPEAVAYVERLAKPLLEQAGPLPFKFSFRVADTDQVNAFALPGGYVTVNRGLLEAAESGEEVAGVIGHEIQHALLRHGTKRIIRQMGGAALLSLALGGTDLHGLSQMSAQLTALSYDRDQESEADTEGVKLLVRSGADPRGLAEFFARLSKDSVHPPELLSTHPDPGDRASLVKEAATGKTFTKLPSPKGIKCH